MLEHPLLPARSAPAYTHLYSLRSKVQVADPQASERVVFLEPVSMGEGGHFNRSGDIATEWASG